MVRIESEGMKKRCDSVDRGVDTGRDQGSHHQGCLLRQQLPTINRRPNLHAKTLFAEVVPLADVSDPFAQLGETLSISLKEFILWSEGAEDQVCIGEQVVAVAFRQSDGIGEDLQRVRLGQVLHAVQHRPSCQRFFDEDLGFLPPGFTQVPQSTHPENFRKHTSGRVMVGRVSLRRIGRRTPRLFLVVIRDADSTADLERLPVRQQHPDLFISSGGIDPVLWHPDDRCHLSYRTLKRLAILQRLQRVRVHRAHGDGCILVSPCDRGHIASKRTSDV